MQDMNIQYNNIKQKIAGNKFVVTDSFEERQLYTCLHRCLSSIPVSKKRIFLEVYAGIPNINYSLNFISLK